jgi:hypothetical protein
LASSSPGWDVDLVVSPSRLHRCLTAALHGAALLALADSALPGWGLALAGGTVAAAGVLAWRAEGRVAARLRLVGAEWWFEGGGRRGMLRQRRARAWRWLVVLDLEGKWQGRRWRQRVVVWPDSVSVDAFRRLRVWLRMAPRRGEERPDSAQLEGVRPAGAKGRRRGAPD